MGDVVEVEVLIGDVTVTVDIIVLVSVVVLNNVVVLVEQADKVNNDEVNCCNQSYIYEYFLLYHISLLLKIYALALLLPTQ